MSSNFFAESELLLDHGEEGLKDDHLRKAYGLPPIGSEPDVITVNNDMKQKIKNLFGFDDEQIVKILITSDDICPLIEKGMTEDEIAAALPQYSPDAIRGVMMVVNSVANS